MTRPTVPGAVTTSDLSTALHACFGATAVITLLLAIAAGSGLFLGAYDHETTFSRNAFRGTDLVSLAVVVPLLVVATRSARRGSTRGLLLWLGALAYVVYQYGYTFAYGWNRLFLIYLVLLALSGFTIARALIAVDAGAVAANFDETAPTRAVSTYLWVVGAGLGVMELAQIVPTLFTGDKPQIVLDTGHPTSPVFILDLGLIVPLMILAGSWLRSNRPWGYIAAVILLVKGATIGLGLLFGNILAVADGAKTDGPLVGLWVAIAAGGALCLWRFMVHANRGQREASYVHPKVSAGPCT